jgi:hypothetical protein
MEATMKTLGLLTLAAVAVLTTAGGASAQIFYSGPGPGYGEHLEPRYERNYGRPRYEREYENRRYRRDDRRDNRRTWNGCRPNYTVQDGVCKPYTGR